MNRLAYKTKVLQILMAELLYNYINLGEDKQLITLESINNRKIYLMYQMGQQSLHTIMHWLINEFKYSCDQYNSMNDFKFSQRGVELETTKDPEVTKNLLSTNPVIKLGLAVKQSEFENYSGYMLDQKKFEQSEQSIMIYIKTLNGKQTMININPNLIKVFELKLKIQDVEGIPPNQQRLVLNGRQLEDMNLLSDYGVEDKASIHLILRLRGGMFNEVSGRNGQYEPLTNIFYDISGYQIENQ